jgi:hypothetical protein
VGVNALSSKSAPLKRSSSRPSVKDSRPFYFVKINLEFGTDFCARLKLKPPKGLLLDKLVDVPDNKSSRPLAVSSLSTL